MLKPNMKSEIRIIVLIVITFTVVTFLGVLVYNNLTQIVGNVTINNESEVKQLLLKEIFSDLSDAESSIKSYSISKNEIYLDPFYNAVSSIDNKMALLYESSVNDEKQIPIIDSLDILIEKKYFILNQFLEINPQDDIQKSLNEISKKLSQDAFSNRDTSIVSAVDTSINNTVVKHKRSIFDKIFGRNKPDTTQQVHINSSDTIHTTSKTEIKNEILKLKTEQVKSLKVSNEKELALILEDKILMDKLRNLFLRLELLEEIKVKEKNENAEKLAMKTNQYVALFCIIASILLLVTAYMLIVYSKRSREYRRGLKAAKIKAEELAQAKQSFLANMSHEIRTPMNAIVGFSDQLSQSELSENQKSQVQIIQKSSEHLLNLINNILDFSKLESGKLTLTNVSFNFHHAIKNIVTILSQQAEKRHNRLSFSIDENIPEFLEGDEVKLNQVLFNIIGNAIKFTNEGDIFLSAKLIENSKDKVLLELSVSDTGIGIKKEHLGRIFNEFEQSDENISKNYGGTGLGLSITKKIVDFQGGKLKVKSQEGNGTTVTVTISYKITENYSESKTKAAESIADKTIKILAADDEEYNRILLKTIFDNVGVELSLVEDGPDVFEKIKSEDFDVILLDLRMPKMNGFDVAKKLRSQNVEIPIIALSATVEEDEILKCYECGMNKFVSKPFKEEDLFKKINKVTRKSSLKSNSQSQQKDNIKDVVGQNEIDYSLEPLIAISNEDDNFVAEMIDVFIQSTQEGVQKIKIALGSGNMTEIANQAHKMASPCRHMEALTTVATLKRIEESSRNGSNKEELTKLVNTLEEKINKLTKALKAER